MFVAGASQARPARLAPLLRACTATGTSHHDWPPFPFLIAHRCSLPAPAVSFWRAPFLSILCICVSGPACRLFSWSDCLVRPVSRQVLYYTHRIELLRSGVELPRGGSNDVVMAGDSSAVYCTVRFSLLGMADCASLTDGPAAVER